MRYNRIELKFIMNVIQSEKRTFVRSQSKFTNELVRKESSLGIRGAKPVKPHNYTNLNAIRTINKTPRYQFHVSCKELSKSSMGPPSQPPRSLKSRLISNSSSTRIDSSSSDKRRPRVLARDSAADTSNNICTPKNRPTALRYISSSSRGGYSGNRSARSTSTSAIEASVILAISEGRGVARGEIGMAAVDLKHPHLVLCQFSDTLLYTHTLTKINYFNPVEIIVPNTFCEGVQLNQLYQLIKDQYPLITVTTMQRRHFNDATGRQQIQSLCAPQYNAVYLQVLHKFYALTAASAVLKYVEYIQCIVFARESLKIEYHSSENTMIIDVGTATQLELVQPLLPSAGPTCCLLGILGPTYTVGGIRALRAALLQPSCNKEFIEARLDAVEDLINNDSGLMTDLQDVIKKLSDIDKILFLCIESPNQSMDKIGEALLNQTILLKTTMDMVPKLIEALNTAESGKLRKIKMDFENSNYNEIAQRIHNIIQDDAHLEKGAMGSLQRCFAVKPNINGLLDVARRTYSELIDDMQKIIEQLSETYDLPIRMNQNVTKGFHIVMPIAPKNRRNFDIEELPPIFIQVQNNGASVSMTTEELVVLGQQAKQSLYEIQKMSIIVISGLLKELRPFMSSLYTLCENVAELDILLAMANASTVGSYIRPEFNSYLDIKNSVHPLVDYNSQVMPVPNDIYASPEHNFTIITGPNMGGKSIYIKQIAIMQIMAQLGCFLPATNAVLRLCDRIFSRIGFNDNVELNASTYVIEMKESQHILKGLTSTSLVIIDELCRGTCSEEGTSIAWAICEELLMSNAFVFFTTHFVYLTRLQDLYLNVVNLHTAVTEEDIPSSSNTTTNSQKRLVYQHKIERGVTKIERYGLALAARTNLPEETVNLAGELAELIIKNRKPQEIRTSHENAEKLLYELNATIRKESRKNQIDADDNIKQILKEFKKDNPQIIENIRIEQRNNATDSSAKCSSGLKRQEISSNFSNILSHKNETSDLCNNVPHDINKNDKRNDYTSVKSSNELLHAYLNDRDQSIDKENSQCTEHNILNSKLKNIGASRNSNNDFSAANNKQNYNEINMEQDNEGLAFITHDSLNEITILSSNNDSDSDIAEALTQVIEECSMEEENRSKQRDESSDANTQDDEDLVEETIETINEELALNELNILNLVLTPPLAFRD